MASLLLLPILHQVGGKQFPLYYSCGESKARATGDGASAMKVGVNLINFGPGSSPDSIRKWAIMAESLGYHLIMISDHVAVTRDVYAQYPSPFYDPFTTLGWLAGITPHVELGTTVMILPYRHPLEIASMASNLDQLSGGKFILGVGVGWAKEEFEALGVPFQQRGAMANDYLRALKAVWSSDVSSYSGRFVRFENVHRAAVPIRSPHPPIWVGGSSEAAMRRAVRFGNGWHPIQVRVSQMRDCLLPRLRSIAEAEKVAVPDFCPRIKLLLTDSPLPEDQRYAGQGTLDQVRSDVAALQEMGAAYLLLDPYQEKVASIRNHESGWRMLATLAEKIFDLNQETLR